MAKIKVLIADDHEVVRQGLRVLIGSAPDIEVAGEAESGTAAVQMAAALKPDVVLLDIIMPGINGIKATRQIRQQVPGSKVMILSACQDEDSVQAALDEGASGYLSKHSAAEELLTGIREVRQGRTFCSARIAARIKSRERRAFLNGIRPRGSNQLSPREHQVLVLLAQGLVNKEIAAQLGVSIKTVEKHRQKVMEKLNIHERAGLTRYALAKGWVSPMDPQRDLPGLGAAAPASARPAVSAGL